MNQADKRLHEIATELVSTKGKLSSQRFLATVGNHWSELEIQLSQVQRNPEVFQAWGRSLNFDENAQTEIVKPKIIKTLSTLFGDKSNDGVAFNAGILHCYGYLFSLIQTPFGLKRTRWTSSLLSKGVGFLNKELQIQCKTGSLIGNLTYFLSRFALPKSVFKRLSGQSWASQVSTGVVDFPYEEFDVESRSVRTKILSGGRLQPMLISYSMVPLIRRKKHSETHLLIYCVGPSRKNLRILTAFPVAEEFTRQILALPKNAVRKDHPLRFNATI